LAWSYASPSTSLADPSGSSAVVAAIGWLQGTLLGTVATTVAVICVATVGLLMLSGRIDPRRAVGVAVGCFIVFGASSIVAGIQATVGILDVEPAASEPFLAPSPLADLPILALPPAAPARPSREPDPFAGAAVPSR
jgi:type IV secretion system protein VirB2